MKMSAAIRNAWKAYTASFGETLKFFLVEACLTMICLAPLLFLSNPAMAPCAWAAAILWLLVMLPARVNAAKAMADALAGGKLGGSVLAETEGYGEKLRCGLKRFGFLLLWGAPLIFCAAVIRIHVSGDVDTFTLIRTVNDLGNGVFTTGLAVIGAVLAVSLLTLAVGCAFHSGARHAFARRERGPVRVRHGRAMLAWLAGLICVLPLLIALTAAVLRYVPVITDLNGLLRKTVSLPDTKGTLIILAAGAVLTLPLLPLRSLISAACAASFPLDSAPRG